MSSVPSSPPKKKRKVPPKKQFKKKFRKVVQKIHFYKEQLTALNMQAGAFDNDLWPYYNEQFRKNVWKYYNNRVDSDSEAQEDWLEKVNVYQIKLPQKLKEEI